MSMAGVLIRIERRLDTDYDCLRALRRARLKPACRRLPILSELLAFCRESVTGAAHRLHQVFVHLTEGFAQPADVHVDGALLDIDVAAPDLIEQLAAGVSALLMGHEKLQQAVFGRADLGGLAVDGDPVTDRD